LDWNQTIVSRVIAENAVDFSRARALGTKSPQVWI